MSAVSGPKLAAIAVREAVARAGLFFASVFLVHVCRFETKNSPLQLRTW